MGIFTPYTVENPTKHSSNNIRPKPVKDARRDNYAPPQETGDSCQGTFTLRFMSKIAKIWNKILNSIAEGRPLSSIPLEPYSDNGALTTSFPKKERSAPLQMSDLSSLHTISN